MSRDLEIGTTAYVIRPYHGEAYLLLGLTNTGAQDILARVNFSQSMKVGDSRMAWIGCESANDEHVKYTWVAKCRLPAEVKELLRHAEFCQWDAGAALLSSDTCDIRARGYLWQIIHSDGTCWRSEEHYDANEVEIHESCTFPRSELCKLTGANAGERGAK
jgi:hypothetical protein